MIRLACIIVGDSSVSSVEVDENDLVGDLKKAIKSENPHEVKCSASKLKLYLARQGNEWLNSDSPDVQQLQAGKKSALIEALLSAKELQGEYSLNESLAGMAQPSTKQIHVLVVVPSDLKQIPISPDSNFAEIRKRYESLSKILAKEEQVKSLSNAIRTVVEGKYEITPFIVLESSSGMGKSQMAFNLEATGEFVVFYLSCANVSEQRKPIDMAYRSRSRAFNIFLDDDFTVLRNVGKVLGGIASFSAYETLFLYNFIHAALLKKDMVKRGRKTREEVRDILKIRNESGKKTHIFSWMTFRVQMV